MRKWLASPVGENEYETFAMRVLHYALVQLFVTALIFVPYAGTLARSFFLPVFLVVMAACYALLHRGRFRLAGLIFISSLWALITITAVSTNGIFNAALLLYPLVIIFAAVLLSDWGVILFTILSLLATTILFIGQMQNTLPLATTPLRLPDRFFLLVGLYCGAGVVLGAAARLIRAGLRRTYEHEQLLLERNRDLEAEIAERKRVEADLRDSEEKYRLLFENIPVMAEVYGLDGDIILLNHAAAAMLDGTPVTLQGRNLREVLAVGDAEDIIQNHVEVRQAGTPRFIERKIKLLNGRDLYYLCHMMPLPGSSQILALTTDLTERYLAQQRERELAVAQEKNAFLADFFSTLSHDLKTPLTVMSTSLYLLQKAQTTEQRAERVDRISEQIDLLNKYIQDMVMISQLEHLPTDHFEPVDLNRVIADVCKLLRPRIEAKQLCQRVTAQPDLPPIRGNADQLQRLLLNLIENAVNYTPAGGEVNITTCLKDAHVMVEVADTGMGIEPEALPHIFERFFRTTKAKNTIGSGTGLGLAIVKKIVETHQATIDVRSQPGKGTTFVVQFPIEVVAER